MEPKMEPKTQAKVTTEKIVLKEILRWLDTNSCTTKYCKPEYAYSVLLYLLIYMLCVYFIRICKYIQHLLLVKGTHLAKQSITRLPESELWKLRCDGKKCLCHQVKIARQREKSRNIIRKKCSCNTYTCFSGKTN